MFSSDLNGRGARFTNVKSTSGAETQRRLVHMFYGRAPLIVVFDIKMSVGG